MTADIDQAGLPNLVYLLGFMGCGKSTLGRQLAEAIEYRFVDLDSVIEEYHGKSIENLFNELGAAGFRKLESGRLEWASRLAQTVIACGGGVVTVEANRRLIESTGFSIYLRVPADVLARRLGRSSRRPLLFGPDGETLQAEALADRIEELLAPRQVLYEQADLTVDLGEIPRAEAADRLVRALYESLNSSI